MTPRRGMERAARTAVEGPRPGRRPGWRSVLPGPPAGAASPPGRIPQRRRLGAAPGLTLLEMLAVLVLVSLLGTLLIQGAGFFLGKYAMAKRVHRGAAAAALRQHWFISTVQAMVPSRLAARRFAGDASSFEGVTLQALAAEPGLPVRARWSIDLDGASEIVVYSQEGGEPWTVLAADGGGLAFQYADEAGRWHDHWPLDTDPRNPHRERIPHMIRLISPDGGTVWLARTELYPEPVPNYAEEL